MSRHYIPNDSCTDASVCRVYSVEPQAHHGDIDLLFQLDGQTNLEQYLVANEPFASVSGVETYSYCDVASLSAIALVLQRRAVAKLSAHEDFPARSECMCLDEHHPMFLQMFPVFLVLMRLFLILNLLKFLIWLWLKTLLLICLWLGLC